MKDYKAATALNSILKILAWVTIGLSGLFAFIGLGNLSSFIGAPMLIAAVMGAIGGFLLLASVQVIEALIDTAINTAKTAEQCQKLVEQMAAKQAQQE